MRRESKVWRSRPGSEARLVLRLGGAGAGGLPGKPAAGPPTVSASLEAEGGVPEAKAGRGGVQAGCPLRVPPIPPPPRGKPQAFSS